jgi:fermentation-respiration switch protein FrsA (DUF1100 family)
MKIIFSSLALFLLALLAGCSFGMPLDAVFPSPSPVPVSLTPTRSITRTRRPTFTRTATPSVTPTSTPSPSATMTLTPAPTASPVRPSTFTPTPSGSPAPTLFPMSIAAMRQGAYPGSQIVVDEELDRGGNYRRYYVYYLSEGLKIYALLTVPDGEMPEGGWPGIVFNHGYIPPDEYQTTERYVDYVDRLASSGYVVFRIDYRGHDNSEGDPQGAYGDPGYEVDVLNAVASLKRFEPVNPEKIGMWGHSMGGYLTLRAMVISPDIKAGVIWAGVVASYPDLMYKWRRDHPSTPPPGARQWRAAWLAAFGTPEQNPAFWESVSANSYLADLSGPLQLHHGTQDGEVPLEFSQTLAEQVQAAGGSVELYTYPGDNHNISNHFSLAMDRTIEFFNMHLK